MMRREIRRRAPGDAAALPASLHPVLRRVYAARGVASGAELEHELRRLLPVSSLDGIDAAAALMVEHLGRGSPILVVGDFDADGATSTALILRQLQRLGHARAAFRVPDRQRHGYGLTPALVAELGGEPAGLLVTVDNGIAAHDGIRDARALGMQVLVTDHHLPGPELPDCEAILNPNLPGAGFGSRALAGVGVAFYLMAAVTRTLEQRRGTRLPPVADLLDLVALGTVADLVPLDQNNRILVEEGLRRMRAGQATAGLLALAEHGGCRFDRLCSRDLAFQIAPRLNAAGRIDDMAIGIRCLLADDAATARGLAAELDRLNRERRDIEGRMRAEADAAVQRLRLREGSLPVGLALYDEGWHAGIVGLVASRLKERLHRPVVAFAPAGDGSLRGSARSVSGVHVRDVLEAIDTRRPGLIARYGGHAMAAGLTLSPEAYPRFAAAFEEEVGRWLSREQIRGVLETDGSLAPEELSLDTALALQSGGPWGQAFPEPLFDGEFAVADARAVGGRHLKLWLRAAPDARPVETIAFGALDAAGAAPPAQGAGLRVAYRLQTTDYGGSERPELRAEYLEALQ